MSTSFSEYSSRKEQIWSRRDPVAHRLHDAVPRDQERHHVRQQRLRLTPARRAHSLLDELRQDLDVQRVLPQRPEGVHVEVGLHDDLQRRLDAHGEGRRIYGQGARADPPEAAEG